MEDSRYQHHRAPGGHPECPERLLAVGRALSARKGELEPLAARPASDEELLRVHPAAHLATIRAAVARAPGHLDPDTYVSPESLD
ncbi:MAG: histone deacetylase, partial [Myxococcales bacterium]|nr:histone deacetylase [Myxococcales bacterium]